MNSRVHRGHYKQAQMEHEVFHMRENNICTLYIVKKPGTHETKQ